MANETKGHPSAADAHLLSAAEALRMWLGELRGDALGGNRVAAMMIALAAEGYVNAALMTLLSRSDFEGVDRLSTPEKYFIGLGYAHQGLELQRSTDEAATLVNLFRIRNDLTHSKGEDGVNQLEALSEAIDACSPLRSNDEAEKRSPGRTFNYEDLISGYPTRSSLDRRIGCEPDGGGSRSP